jgi:catechol 2,3-dioxygenase-like lactoylglutathione lyase family enzyme
LSPPEISCKKQSEEIVPPGGGTMRVAVNRRNQMAKIRHIAIKAQDPERLVQFYENAFDMEVILRRESGAIYMTDGYMNIAVLPVRTETDRAGIDHFGFEVDDLDDVFGKLKEEGMEPPTAGAHNPPYAEVRGYDPEGNGFDLTVHGFKREEYQEDRADAAKEPETADA